MNHTCCPLKSRQPNALRTEIATYRARCRPNDDGTAHPLETRATKMSYLVKLSSLHLEPACPPSWWKNLRMQPGKTKKQNKRLRTYHTYPPDATLEQGCMGGLGKVFKTETQSYPRSWENHKWPGLTQRKRGTKPQKIAWGVTIFLHYCLVQKIQFPSLSLRSDNVNCCVPLERGFATSACMEVKSNGPGRRTGRRHTDSMYALCKSPQRAFRSAALCSLSLFFFQKVWWP